MFKAVVMSFMVAAAALSSSLAAAEGKVAVLDVQGAILGTDIAQKRLQDLRNEPDFKDNQQQLERLKKEYNDIIAKLQKDLAVMSPEQKEAQRKKIEEKRSDIQHVIQQLQQSEQDLEQTLMQQLQPAFKKAVADIIKNQNIGLLLDRRAAMYVDNSYNITPQVTDALNKAEKADAGKK